MGCGTYQLVVYEPIVEPHALIMSPPKRTCSDSVTPPSRFGSTVRRPRTMAYMLKPTMPSNITQKLNCSYQSTLRPTGPREADCCHSIVMTGWLSPYQFVSATHHVSLIYSKMTHNNTEPTKMVERHKAAYCCRLVGCVCGRLSKELRALTKRQLCG